MRLLNHQKTSLSEGTLVFIKREVDAFLRVGKRSPVDGAPITALSVHWGHVHREFET
jgi:hypothetical protein